MIIYEFIVDFSSLVKRLTNNFNLLVTVVKSLLHICATYNLNKLLKHLTNVQCDPHWLQYVYIFTRLGDTRHFWSTSDIGWLTTLTVDQEDDILVRIAWMAFINNSWSKSPLNFSINENRIATNFPLYTCSKLISYKFYFTCEFFSWNVNQKLIKSRPV